MKDLVLLWPIAVAVILAVLGLTTKEIMAWQKSKNAINHPALLKLSGDLLDFCNMAIAWMQANPTATPQDALAWVKKEAVASVPQTISDAGAAASDEGFNFMVSRKLMSAAMAAPASDATKAIITALAPSVLTARVSPPQVAAVASVVATEAPLTMTALLDRMPALSGLLAENQPATSGSVVSGGTAILLSGGTSS